MTPGRIPPSAAWMMINQLGDQILAANGLNEQKKLIESVACSLLHATARLWLDERLFRLPGLNQGDVFDEQPPEGVMRHAWDRADECCQEDAGLVLAMPLRSQDLVVGVLEIEPSPGKKFKKAEIELLEVLTGHAALALVAAHRFSVDQWRVEQLTLVRRVSSQIANELDLRSLAKRVTRLILDTFQYYYVAIFTLRAGEKALTFWSSAGKEKTHKRGAGEVKVELGQGMIGEAAKSGVEIISNNVAEEPRFRPLEPLPGTRSEAVLPLKIGDQVLGILDIQSDEMGAFHPNDLLVLRALADTIAIAVNSARLYSDLDKRASQLAIVAEVSNEFTAVLELDELLARVATLIHEKLKFSHVLLFTVHSNRRQVIFEAGSGERSDALKGYTIDLDNAEGMIPWAARNGEVLLAKDVRQETRYKPSPFPPQDTRSELTIPLTYDGKTIGVLDLQSDRVNAFSEDDLFILKALAGNVAVAIHNADLFRTEKWRRQVADSLREVAGLLSADAGVDDVLDSVLRELERNLPCDVSAAWLLDGEGISLAHIHGADTSEAEAAMQRWPEVKQYLMGTLEALEPVIRKPSDPFGPTGMARGFSADYSSIAVALRVGDRPLGVLTLSHHTTGRYGHEAQAITTTFASYAAVAIENARLYDSAQEQAYASAALLQVAQTVVNSNSLEEMIGSIIRITPILVGVKACAIYLGDGDQFKAGLGYGFPDDVQAILCGRNFGPGDFSLLDETRTNGKMTVGILTATAPEDWLEPELARDDAESYYALQTGEHLLIGIPLVIRNDFYGVMVIHEEAESLRFRSKRIEIVSGIAQQVAMGIENDTLQLEMVARERLEHEIQLARQIQKTFLPERLPELKDWEIDAVWRTARQVGGDFYDVFELPDNKLGLFIADVSDKGIPAALFMALTRTLFRAAVLDTNSPAEVMRRVNDLIIPDNREAMFVTAVYGVLDIETGAFVFANAGHNPPILLRKESGILETLHRTGAALGVIEDLGMTERTILLGSTDILIFYTDGLTEAFSPSGDTFGVERVEQVLLSGSFGSAHESLETLEKAVDSFIEQLPLADDMTMLAIKRTK